MPVIGYSNIIGEISIAQDEKDELIRVFWSLLM